MTNACTPLQLVYPAISLVDIVILVILVIFTGTGGGNHDNSSPLLSVN